MNERKLSRVAEVCRRLDHNAPGFTVAGIMILTLMVGVGGTIGYSLEGVRAIEELKQSGHFIEGLRSVALADHFAIVSYLAARGLIEMGRGVIAAAQDIEAVNIK